MRNFLSKIFKKIGNIFDFLSLKIIQKKSKLLKNGSPRSLYKTPSNDLFWLNKNAYLDNNVINYGEFEPLSTALVRRFLKSGDTVLDIGANIGYYSVIFSKIVGEKGTVFAFEPTKHFLPVLEKNLDVNDIKNVKIIDYGLSNKSDDIKIDIGPSSATIHSPKGYDAVIGEEIIKLRTLREFVDNNKINKIDFIKIDIDGHEPIFFDGSWEILDKFSPLILCEISPLHYLEAGYTAWDFYASVRSHNYFVYDERGLQLMDSREKFLQTCANFNSTTNLLLTKNIL